jgi:uncharacterized protein YkwD/murein DD-endopeptidase MepM/ murein hydrolase activator NlpD
MIAALLSFFILDIAGYARPADGHLLISGSLTKISGNTLTLDVAQVINSKGVELNLASPISQFITVNSDSEILSVDLKHRGSLKQLKLGPLEACVVGDALTRAALVAKRLCATLDSPRAEPLASRSGPRARSFPVEPDGVCREPVEVPMVFPVIGVKVPSDTWLTARGGGSRRHLGQDIMGAKLLPLVACFDGTVYTSGNGANAHYRLTIVGDNGWTAEYMHVNNDSPGTNDGLGGPNLAFAPGIVSGARVRKGQLVGWNGNSGNAESVGPHCHFELWQDGACFNAHPSLKIAQRVEKPSLYLPAPDQKPEKGEIRVDGAVRSFDPTRNILIIGVTAEQRFGKPPEPESQPRARYLNLAQSSFASLSGAPLATTTQFKVGDVVVAFAPEAEPGKALMARKLFIPLGDQQETAPPPSEYTLVQSRPPLRSDPSVQNPAPTTINLLRSDLAQPVLDAINAYRKRYNAPPLTMHKSLAILAQTHAQDMAGQDFLAELAQPLTAAKALGFKGSQAISLVAGEEEDGWKAVHLWLRDARARDAMLSPTMSTLGVGFVELAKDEGNVRVGKYWTIVLGAP